MKQCVKFGKYFPDDEAIETVKTILNRGGDVEIRLKGDGFIILEVNKKIKYST